MKRVIRASISEQESDNKFWTAMLPADKLQDRLKISVASVRENLLDNVLDADKEIFLYLINNKVIPTVVSSHDMRNNPYYDLEDKFIQLSRNSDNFRTYTVPYPGGGRFDTGKIFVKDITVFDDGTIRFGNGKIRDPYRYSASTLKSEFYRN